ncbi:MAG: hypothetical protein EBR82_41070 [Caulobacteraceae bacterium]|nr:hypothetical protein [Caulobacteraceae bacterium]
MSIRARVDVDVVFHDYTDSSLSVGSTVEHIYVTPGGALTTAGTVGTTAVTIAGPASCTAFAVKNTGSSTIRIGGVIDVPPGRLCVTPTTATISVAAGTGSFSCVWVG